MNRRELMKEAWRRAREAADKFGGKAQEYISDAMKDTWFTVHQNQNDSSYYDKCLEYIKNQMAYWAQPGFAGLTKYNNAILNAYQRMYTMLEDFKKNNPLDYATFFKQHQKQLTGAIGQLEDWQYQYHNTSDAGGVLEKLYEIFYGHYDYKTASPEETIMYHYYVDADNELSAATAEILDDMDITSPDFQY